MGALLNTSGDTFLGPEWTPLIEAFELVFSRVTHESSTSVVQTLTRKHAFSPDFSPYVQARLYRDGSLLVELADGDHKSKVAAKRLGEMKFLGWNLPTGSNPHFSRIFNVGWEARQLGEQVLEVLVSLLDLEVSDWFHFMTPGMTPFIAAHSKLKLFAKQPYFTVPGYNRELLV